MNLQDLRGWRGRLQFHDRFYQVIHTLPLSSHFSIQNTRSHSKSHWSTCTDLLCCTDYLRILAMHSIVKAVEW